MEYCSKLTSDLVMVFLSNSDPFSFIFDYGYNAATRACRLN